ncbi:MAG: hypothetical protein MZW92_22115 [Comamonadaceae bacterium]|nr:hypothetical protein [Comamonadaceae bacterium]
MLPPAQRFMPRAWLVARAARSPAGPDLHDLMLLPIERAAALLRRACACPAPLDEATELLLDEIRTRLQLPVRRRPRLPHAGPPVAARCRGGEVQRINLTTALGTSLVNTLFVLDEPSRSACTRATWTASSSVMHRLRDAGNTLVVVEHDPAGDAGRRPHDRHGPGPGERGGQHRLRRHAGRAARDADTLTGAYLGGAQAASAPALRARRSTEPHAAARCSKARASTT